MHSDLKTGRRTFPSAYAAVIYRVSRVSTMENQNGTIRDGAVRLAFPFERKFKYAAAARLFRWPPRSQEAGEWNSQRNAEKERGRENDTDGYINRTVRTCPVEFQEFTPASNNVPDRHRSRVTGEQAHRLNMTVFCSERCTPSIPLGTTSIM